MKNPLYQKDRPRRAIRAGCWYDDVGFTRVSEYTRRGRGFHPRRLPRVSFVPLNGEIMKNPLSQQSTSARVRRGGSWDLIARNARVSYRRWYDASFRGDYFGLRVFRTTEK